MDTLPLLFSFLFFSFLFFFSLPPLPSSSNVRFSRRSGGRQRSYFFLRAGQAVLSRWNPREINVKFQSRRCVETWHLLNDYLHWTRQTLFILDTSNVSQGREALRNDDGPGRCRSNVPRPSASVCAHVCRVSSERPSFPAREIHKTWDIYSREKFFQLRVTSRPEKRRSRPRSRSRQSSTYPRRILIRDPPFSHLRVSRKGWNRLPLLPSPDWSRRIIEQWIFLFLF